MAQYKGKLLEELKSKKFSIGQPLNPLHLDLVKRTYEKEIGKG